MKIILLENISNLGKLGDVVNVRPGYARNYLFPQSKADRASDKIVANFAERREEIEKQLAEQRARLEKARDNLQGQIIKIKALSGADGNLYGSITAEIIVAAINGQELIDFPVKRNQIVLAEGNIRTLGSHAIQVMIASELSATIKISVLSETDSKPDSKQEENKKA